MRDGPFDKVLEHLIAGLKPPDGVRLTDGELLARFVKCRDSEALSVLVQRHAGMVWGVCCRHLPNRHDAEDAFQATFFVLVRKASAVPEEMIANWLYGVARQTSVRMRATAAKQARREMQVANLPEPPLSERGNADLVEVVETELSRLPDHYRAVVVLCDLEGLTRRDAAVQLGIPEGSVASRLARARELLTKRLDRRSIQFSLTLLALLSAKSVSSAPTAVVLSLLASKSWDLLAAGQAAGVVSANIATLTKEVLKTMFITKVKSLLMVSLILGMALGVTGLGLRLSTGPDALAQAPKPDVEKPKPEDRPAPKENLTDKDLLQGEWETVEVQVIGKWETERKNIPGKMLIEGDHITLNVGKETRYGVFRFNSPKIPRRMEIITNDLANGRSFADIELLKKEQLSVFFHTSETDLPQELKRCVICKMRRTPTSQTEEARMMAALQGTWHMTGMIPMDGMDEIESVRYVFKDDMLKIESDYVRQSLNTRYEFKIQVNTFASPMRLDLVRNHVVIPGIFRISNNRLCIYFSDKKRPNDFNIDNVSSHDRFILLERRNEKNIGSGGQELKFKNVRLDQIDEKAMTVSVSLNDKGTKLINLPVSAETRVVAPKIFPGVDKHTLFRWNYLKGLQGERVTLHLRINDAGETMVELISME